MRNCRSCSEPPIARTVSIGQSVRYVSIEAYGLLSKPQRPRAGCYLYNTSNHVRKLIRDNCRDHKEEDASGSNPPSWGDGGECWSHDTPSTS